MGVQGSTMGVRWEYDGSTREYDGSTMGVRWEYKGSTREYKGVQREYDGSTVGVQWEYSGSTMGGRESRFFLLVTHTRIEQDCRENETDQS
jgi:hypothetical protein